MDPRGAGSLAEDPAGHCEQLAQRAGLEIPHILEARAHAAAELERVGVALAAESLPPDTSVCLFGSWARGELTRDSDADWALLISEPTARDDPQIAAAVELLARHLEPGGKAPGAQGIFGCAFDVRKLIEDIGLDRDTNKNLTRRMLLLLESVSVTGELREEAWTRVLDRYFNYGVKPYHVPRFLLNDLIRYWRTICVDFEGKNADTQGNDPKWVERVAKLKISRKLLFAGGLVPILLCDIKDLDEMRPFLERWLAARPLDRLAAGFETADMQDEGMRALAAYDRWLGILHDSAQRAHLRQLDEQTRHGSSLYAEVAEIARTFQLALEALLFESALTPLARQFLVF